MATISPLFGVIPALSHGSIYRGDFQYTFNLMLGQLNASHMGMRGVDNPKE